MLRIFRCLVFFVMLFSLSCAASQNNGQSNNGSGDGSGITLSPDGTATLIVTNGVRILKLSGTNYQMGYNHGYLLAADIVNVVCTYVNWLAQLKAADYDDLLASQGIVGWSADILEEMNGMLAGIRDALPASQLSFTPYGSTNRQLTLEDLEVANILADWACSSFSVWGTGRADGSSMMARNLDYYLDPYGVIANEHLIVSYHPAQGTKWVNIAFCGMVGSISGMNEFGVCGAMHDTDNYATSDSYGYVPRSIALRRLFERLSNTTVPADAESCLDGLTNYRGNNFHMLYPASGRADTNIGFVLEYDGYTLHADGRCTLRTVADNPNLPTNAYFDQRLSFSNALVNVNHYVKRRTSAPLSGNNSGTRYIVIKNGLSNAMLDGDVTVEEGRQIMSQVGVPYSAGGTVYTLQTMVFEPDTMRFHIWFAATNSAAYDRDSHTFNFSDLF